MDPKDINDKIYIHMVKSRESDKAWKVHFDMTPWTAIKVEGYIGGMPDIPANPTLEREKQAEQRKLHKIVEDTPDEVKELLSTLFA